MHALTYARTHACVFPSLLASFLFPALSNCRKGFHLGQTAQGYLL